MSDQSDRQAGWEQQQMLLEQEQLEGQASLPDHLMLQAKHLSGIGPLNWDFETIFEGVE